MGEESIAHEAEGRMGYWLSGHEGERNNCFSKIQLVVQNYRAKGLLEFIRMTVPWSCFLGELQNNYVYSNQRVSE